MDHNVTVADRLNALSFTENLSLTYSTTLQPCLDFFFDVLQRTEKEIVLEKLSLAWEHDSLLTLKLVFQLRDIRNGKGAQAEFFHCLLWLYEKHPETLYVNLEHVPRHGYWKDLYLLVKFILDGNVSLTTPKTERKFKPRRFRSRDTEFVEEISLNTNIEEIAKKRLGNQINKKQLKQYFLKITHPEERKSLKAKYRLLIEKFQKELREQAAKERKVKRQNLSGKVSELRKTDLKFARFYDRVVELSVKALQENLGKVKQRNSLQIQDLCGKWAPTIGCSIDRFTSLGKSIAKALYPESRYKKAGESNEDYLARIYGLYQKEYLTPLRKVIEVPEVFMSANKWESVNYDRVPSVCMKNNKEHFLKHDKDRFGVYLDQVKTGEKKIASGALMPHEIVREVLNHRVTELQQVTELQWQSYADKLRKCGTLSSALAICDVSGSMAGIPMEVAIAMSLLTAELSSPPFNGYICSFSETPQMHLVNQPTLLEKIRFVQNMDWGMNTNLQAVFDLILEMARGIDLPSDKMIKTLFIFSDMEFDCACSGHQFLTDYEIICSKFQASGYQVPSIVFWNLRAGNRSKPVLMDQQNVAMISGFSGQMMKTFLENGTFPNPYETIINTLGNHYDHLKVVD